MPGIPSTFRRTPAGISVLSGPDREADRILQVLTTRGGDDVTAGEHPYDGRFGCRLHRLLHMPVTDATTELARAEVVRALAAYVPAAKVESVTPIQLDGDLRFRVSYVLDGQRRVVEVAP